ncbi:ATP-binding protein [Rossellomorea aquimaris]|uniref:histidine kinase n=1 Tax=Rossellomorea aquimaris TaxID=189382 RepID=A0A366EV30_9BACI|nr:ATP-binding protein [Rossellomorea aquimaris]RBP05345.1 signal transduction histidine kinase [Rossellomorea aquimaris]
MNWNRIVVKLGGSILLIVLIILLPLGFVTQQIFSGFYYSKVQDQLMDLSKRYAESISSVDNTQILQMFETLATMTDKEIVIVDSKGKVLANSGLPSFENGRKVTMKPLLLKEEENVPRYEYEDPLLDESFLYIGRPIFDEEDQFIGSIYVFSSIGPITQSLEVIKNLLILAGVGSILLASGLIYFVSKRLSRPLLDMVSVTRGMAKGELHSRVGITTGDEIGALGRSINDLAIELESYRTNRKEFFASVSHELRTPLAYVDGYARVLKEGIYETEEEKERYLSIIEQEAARMTKLVNDLFELSKMEEGHFHLLLEEVDLIEVVESTLEKTQLKAKEKGLRVSFDSVISIPTIYADGLRIEQVLINLVENAIRYTEEGSIVIRLLSEDSYVAIEIEDTGIGIPESEIPFLFDRFYRVEKSRSRKYGGTGLGLSIVKHLVSLQNGSIDVQSKVGKGTKVTLRFPIYMEESS